MEGARIQPHDDFAERAVLGSMMLDQRAVSSAEETLRSADFYNPKHREIFEVLLLLSGKKRRWKSCLSPMNSKKEISWKTSGASNI